MGTFNNRIDARYFEDRSRGEITMNTVTANQFEQQVSSVFENCISRISAELKKNFDPNKKNMIALFRLFCSSVKTRNSWISSISKPKHNNHQSQSSINKTNGKTKSIKQENPSPFDKIHSFVIPEKKGVEYQHPIKPEHKKSGLLMKR